MKKVLIWFVAATFPCLILLATAWVNWNAIREASLAKKLDRSSVEIVADVIQRETSRSLKTFTTASISYRFTPKGQTQSLTATRPVDASTFQRLDVRKSTAVRYLPSDPSVSDIVGNDMAFFATLYAVIMDLIVALSFGAAIYVGVKSRKA
jgi:hypothetical protein